MARKIQPIKGGDRDGNTGLQQPWMVALRSIVRTIQGWSRADKTIVLLTVAGAAPVFHRFPIHPTNSGGLTSNLARNVLLRRLLVNQKDNASTQNTTTGRLKVPVHPTAVAPRR